MHSKNIGTELQRGAGEAVLLLALIAIGALSGYFIFFNGYGHTPNTINVSNFSDGKGADLLPVAKVTPPNIPFREMTIPGLRDREYESSLGELKKISENARFTAYTASYDSDGYWVNGLLTVPKGGHPASGGWPAVVFVHGYISPAEYRTEVNYASYVNALANSVVVFKIDLRGHDKSEGEAFGAYYSDAYVVDTLNAYAALKNTDFVDPERIGLWGHSMAGNVVFRSFVVKPEIKKAVIWAGAGYTYTDLGEYNINDNSYRPPAQDSERQKKRDDLFDTYGRFDPSSDFWKQVPGTNYLNGVTGDIQIHHAVNDSVVSIEYSRNLKKLLENTGIVLQLFEYPNGGHNLTGSSFTTAMRRSAEFLANY